MASQQLHKQHACLPMAGTEGCFAMCLAYTTDSAEATPFTNNIIWMSVRFEHLLIDGMGREKTN